MKALVLIFCCVMFAAAAFALSGPPALRSHPEPSGGSLDQVWGPDAYGYVARDNSEPNGPTFNWLDISTTGTHIGGLGDDNTVGPFPIGFNFHYYWYDVTQFWVGSNGYIQFQPGGLLAQTFPNFPNPALPNDVIGPYVADWIFGQSPNRPASPSACYYQTLGGDTLIVMWKNTAAWQSTPAPNPDWVGDHNFELILVRHDSSFTFQYGTLTAGDVSNSDIKVGMENVAGSVGMQLFSGTYPSSNYAIKFYYPPVVTYIAHDLGIAGVQNPISGGFFLLQGDILHPELMVKDVGNQTESSFHCIYSVRSLPNNALLTSADSLCTSINAAQILDLSYPLTWTAGAPGTYRVTGRVNLTTDVNHTNDSVRVQLHTLNLPGELYYDDNSAEQGWSWQGGSGGMGNQFVSPIYPCRITQLRYYIYTTAGGLGMIAKIYRDSAGAPGAELFSQTVSTLTNADWNTITVNPPVEIDSGAFYVAWMQLDSLTTYGLDTTATQGSSRRGWEYSSVWSEFRYGQVQNPMIRCTVDSLRGPNQPPSITGHLPQSLLDTVGLNQTVHFSVTATDPDGDSLRFRWTRGGVQVGTNFSADISFPSLGSVPVKCVVSDGQLADSVTWTVSVIDLAADDNSATLPTIFALRPAYPNPFNPSTSFTYDVPRDGQVTLKVYDLLGNEVASLVNTRVTAGSYSVSWNAASQPSGMYFAVLKANNVHFVQKLLLMK